MYHIYVTCTGCKAVLVLPIPSTVVTAMPSTAHNGSKQPFAEKCLSSVKFQLQASIRCTYLIEEYQSSHAELTFISYKCTSHHGN